MKVLFTQVAEINKWIQYQLKAEILKTMWFYNLLMTLQPILIKKNCANEEKAINQWR